MFACFKRPAMIVAWLREEHGLECPITQIIRYNPTSPWFEAGDEYRTIFEAARKAYLHDVALVPIAQTAFRLNELFDLYESAKRKGNHVLAAALLEQAAKDAGGVFSNVRVNVPGDVAELTAEERRERLTALLDRALGANAQAPATKQ